jgi:hypothetical protein
VGGITSMGKQMTTEQENIPKAIRRCVICGTPITKNNHCGECVARGFGPCEACEGLSLLEVEEDAS